MKPQTLQRIQQLEQFPDVSAEEMYELVYLEYGHTEQCVIQLFQCIVRKFAKEWQ